MSYMQKRMKMKIKFLKKKKNNNNNIWHYFQVIVNVKYFYNKSLRNKKKHMQFKNKNSSSLTVKLLERFSKKY